MEYIFYIAPALDNISGFLCDLDKIRLLSTCKTLNALKYNIKFAEEHDYCKIKHLPYLNQFTNMYMCISKCETIPPIVNTIVVSVYIEVYIDMGINIVPRIFIKDCIVSRYPKYKDLLVFMEPPIYYANNIDMLRRIAGLGTLTYRN